MPWSLIRPTGLMTAAVPHRPHSAKSGTSEKYTSRSSTGMCRYFSATTSRLRRVTEGRMESLLGVTSLPSLVTKMKFAPPVSSTFVRVAASRYMFSAKPSRCASIIAWRLMA